jgi:hypothetical protein
MIDSSKLDNFLYLLSEMEGALALGGIGWNATTAVNVRDRLIAVTSEIAIIAERFEGARWWQSTKPARGSIWRPEGGRNRNRSLLLRRRSSPDLASQRVCRGLVSPRDVAFYHALAKFSDVLNQPLQGR